MTNESPPVMELQDMEKHFAQTTGILANLKQYVMRQEKKKVRAVDGVSLSLRPGEVKGVIGESGCGKTTLLKTLMGLHDHTGGEFLFRGKNVSEFSKEDWKEFRRDVQFIFQDPFNSMDPKFNVRDTLAEPLKIHGIEDRETRIHEVLEEVKLNPPEKYIDRYPDQLSGGEKQRVSIARALILEPEVLLADEPVSMLDVSTQAAVLQDLHDITQERNVSMLYISHDLSTVSYVCQEVNVMYLGRIIESAPTQEILHEPKHPYTQALIHAIPIPDPHYGRERTSMKGTPSNPIDMPTGCRFKDRCPERMDICDKRPVNVDLEETQDHDVACHLYYDHQEMTGNEKIGDQSTDRRVAGDGGEEEI